jgi:hypothetical protein
MKLSQVKALLPTVENVSFKLENGTFVPEHVHVTEIGIITKHFIDCGGTVRNEKVVSFQLWSANDVDHRLKPAKLLHIIELCEKHLDLEEADIEVEYQRDTIGKYALAFDGTSFILQNKSTACLALDKCGMPQEKRKVRLSDLTKVPSACCTVSSDSVKDNCGCNATVAEGAPENTVCC